MKQFSIWGSAFLIGLIITALLFQILGFRVNLTDSIPVGLYQIQNGIPIKNAFVIFCPDERRAFRQGLERAYIGHGLCAGGYGYLMKQVVATEGDIISVSTQGVYVNKKPIPYSKPKSKDAKNRKLEHWQAVNYQLKKDEFLTMSNQSEYSFDSRYYGLIHKEQIKGAITPIWTKTTLEKKYEQ